MVGLVVLLAACSGGEADGGGAGQADPGGPGTSEAGTAEPGSGTDGQAGAWLESLVPAGFRGAVAVVDSEDVVLASGYGPVDPERGATPIDADTRFAIGSITKDLVNISVLLLQHRSELQTSDTLGDLLPDVPADKAGITVTQLMSHTAGFEHVHGSDDELIGRQEALQRILNQELRFEPGTGEHYSNSGYTLLAAIIEEVSGRDFDDFLQEEIFGPAGMANTGFKGDPVPPGETEAVGLDEDDEPVAPGQGRGPLSWTLRGNGGVVSSVTDLLAFDRAVCGGDVLPQEVVQQLGYCGTSGGYGTAGGGSEFSHTASLEKDLDHDMLVIVLSAGWGHPAEEIAFALVDHLVGGAPLPDLQCSGEAECAS